MSNSLGFIKTVIYKLKRQFGLKMEVIHDVTTTDLATGKKTVVKQFWTIKQAIQMPEISKHSSIFALFLKTQFRQGSELNLGDMFVIIDGRDVPDDWKVSSGKDWYAVIKSKRYEILEARSYEENAAYFLTLRELKGTPLERIIEITVRDRISVAEAIS